MRPEIAEELVQQAALKLVDHAYEIIDEGWQAHYWDRWRAFIESAKE